MSAQNPLPEDEEKMLGLVAVGMMAEAEYIIDWYRAQLVKRGGPHEVPPDTGRIRAIIEAVQEAL